MAYVWIQPWYYALPVILEEPVMGDGNRGQTPFEHQPPNYPDRSRPGHNQNQSSRSRMEFEQQPYPEQSFALQRGTSPFNMESMASALPNYPNPSATYGPQHSLPQSYPATPGQGMLYQYPSMVPFAGQTGPSSQYLSLNQQQFAQQYQHSGQTRALTYPNMITSPSQRGVMPGAQQFQVHQGQSGHYPSSFGQAGQPMANTPMQMAPFAQNYPRHSPYNYMTGQPPQDTYFVNLGQTGAIDSSTHLHSEHSQGVSRQSSASSLGPSVPRGPPPKPKQSGHALWVGNLPPGTNIFDLKDHFSRDATDDIESVFLISKSNCAFANYKTEVACAAAMQRFNDTRFLGARLVCRLRRANPTASASQAASTTQNAPSVPTSPETEAKEIVHEVKEVEDAAPVGVVEEPENEQVPAASEQPSETASRVKEKFFIIKSLTVEDLELSVRNGIWATQAHNETALNTAFESAENVFLIFSANKSGEYFGYARMVSSISEESAATIDFTPRSATVTGVETELPNKIPTPATATAPRGYVIDDSARGTIFWEAETADDQPTATESAGEGDTSQAQTTQSHGEGETQPTGETQSFGKPFRIEWVSTEKLPFYRTRGLRNPWNANREIKIARDGTELEPGVGRRLIAMFHRPQVAGPSNAPRQPQVAQSYQMPPMMGFNPSVHQQQRFYQG